MTDARLYVKELDAILASALWLLAESLGNSSFARSSVASRDFESCFPAIYIEGEHRHRRLETTGLRWLCSADCLRESAIFFAPRCLKTPPSQIHCIAIVSDILRPLFLRFSRHQLLPAKSCQVSKYVSTIQQCLFAFWIGLPRSAFSGLSQSKLQRQIKVPEVATLRRRPPAVQQITGAWYLFLKAVSWIKPLERRQDLI